MALVCHICKETKPDTEFYPEPRNTGRNGRESRCKDCSRVKTAKYKELNSDKVKLQQRISKRKKRTNFTNELYESTLNEQGGVCAICGTDTPGGRGTFHADHDHSNGKPRGVLCHSCNVGLGHFLDNADLLQAALDYLNKYLEVK
jgi:hypothetical protein